MRVEVAFAKNCLFSIGPRTEDRPALARESVRAIRELLLATRGKIDGEILADASAGIWQARSGRWQFFYTKGYRRSWFGVGTLRVTIKVIVVH